ncbi:hypothetical protein E4U48_005261 [Claviceps purpurea]|nr:hypothetical protein E4U12_002797 [Claviceps purpurea]KAG6282121.1 hypothetical protein E4U48_005261 [Claviceps purpurea]KAG6296208.1 hypothetical protein E4U46_002876 [Claviceps purpurea]
MTLPFALPGLTRTEAVTDALHRVLAGFDHNDVDMFKSAFAEGEDVTMEIRDETNLPPFKGLSAIVNKAFGFVSKLDTTHMASNIRVFLETDEKASLVCLVSAQHAPAGRAKEPSGPKYLVGAEYEISLVRESGAEGLWKIMKWIARVQWADGDAGVMKPSTE